MIRSLLVLGVSLVLLPLCLSGQIAQAPPPIWDDCGCDQLNIIPYGDFEDPMFVVNVNGYFSSIGLPECDPLPLINSNGPGNTPGIIQDGNNKAVFLSGAYGGQGQFANPESIIIPLCRPIPVGCTAWVSFKARRAPFAKEKSEGLLEFYATHDLPCLDNDVADCQSTPSPGDYYCMEPNGFTIDHDNWTSYFFSWTNLSNEPLNFLVVSNNVLLLEEGVDNRASLWVDDINLTSQCFPEVSINPVAGASVCVGETTSESYEVCVSGPAPGPSVVTLQIDVPNGVVVSNGTLVAPGLYEVPVTGWVLNGTCGTATVDYVIDGSVWPAGSTILLELTPVGQGACIDNQLPQLLTVEECGPCPTCDDYVSLSPLGTPLSTLITQGVEPFASSPTTLDLTNSCLFISGILEIDIPYTITGGEIQMDAGAGIIVKDNQTVDFISINENGGLHACDTMWRGITLEFGAIFTMMGTTVQDAQYAVWHQHKATATIRNNTFIDNYISYYMNDDVVTPSFFDLAQFHSNRITENDDLLPPYPGQNPMPGTRSYAGVSVNNGVLPVQIGLNVFDPLSIFTNSIELVGNGIVSNFAGLEVANTTFSKIQVEAGEPYPMTGFGIHHVGDGDSPLTQVGLNFTGSPGAASFSDTHIGIYCEGASISSILNNMDNLTTGYDITLANNQDIDVSRNDLQVSSLGVNLLNNDLANSINVSDNKIVVGILGVVAQAVAINVREANNGHPNRPFIGDNNIIANTASGIVVMNANDYDVFQNNITLPGNGQGINTRNFNNGDVYENYISGSGAGIGIGVRMTNADNSLYRCNTVEALRTGWLVRGILTATNLFKNTFVPPFRDGLVYRANVSANQQLNNGNIWQGTSADYLGAAAVNEILNTGIVLVELDNMKFTVNSNLNAAFRPPSFSFPNLSGPSSNYDPIWFQEVSDIPPSSCLLKLQDDKEEVSLRAVDRNDKISWKVFPNPATEYVNVQFGSVTHGKVLLKDINGTTIKTEQVQDALEVMISVDDLVPGVYFLSVQTSAEGHVQSKRIIIH